jgi:hypothetical protein
MFPDTAAVVRARCNASLSGTVEFGPIMGQSL